MQLILDWIDLIWLPVVFFVVEPKLRWIAVCFIISCMFMLRMQMELLEGFGFEKEGIPGLMTSDPFQRGLITYSTIILLYVVLSVQSKRTDPIIYMAASITIFFIAFILSAVIMSL